MLLNTAPYWPWWAVGAGLAAVFVLSYRIQHRLLGVSGLLETVLTENQNVLFVLCLALGGTLAHGFEPRTTLGPYENPLLPLFGGGLLIGFGTRWAGGCTSGHGLNGCARLQPASLLSTAAFFGSGVAVSFLL